MTNNVVNQAERDELHSKLWSLSNTLRGAVDGWDFKQYVLGTMFYRFISENLTSYINENERENEEDRFDYSDLKDEDISEDAKNEIIKEKGFFIYPSELFSNVCKIIKIANDSNCNLKKEYIEECKKFCNDLNVNIERIFSNIEHSAVGTDSELAIKGLFSNFEVNSNNLGDTTIKRTKKLETILLGIEGINFGNLKDKKIDVFGDAYEYLMGMYASDAGKVGGEYFTPQEVSRLVTTLAISNRKEVDKVYDPACGSGSLLLQAAKILGTDKVRKGFFGQEINPTTYNLCRINMFLHDVGYDKFSIACDDTLLSPQHWDDEPFDVIVSNPPYSIPWKGENDTTLINDPRFSPAGVLAPKNNSDFAFILHSLAWLSSNGTGAFVCFYGIMSRPGAEQKIRKYLVDNNYIDSLIYLPANMFFGVGISTYIMILKKNKTRTGIFYINASKEYIKAGNKNKLSDKNIANICKIYNNKEEIANVSRMVSYEEIKSEENDYDLSIGNYIEEEKIKEEVDLELVQNEAEETAKLSNILREDINNALLNKLAETTLKIDTKIEKNLSKYFQYYRGKRLKQGDREKGELPFVTAGFQNKGIAGYISNDVEIFEYAITIDMFGYAEWRPYKFGCDDNIIVLKGDFLSEETAYFYLAAIRSTSKDYNYTNQYRLQDLKKHNIYLPTRNNEIDEEKIKAISSFFKMFNDIEYTLQKEKEFRKKQSYKYMDILLNEGGE